MQLTFIEAASGTPLVKKFTQDRVVPYPNVSAVNSHEFNISPDEKGLKDFHDLLQKGSKKGWALLRGPLIKELCNESRKGQHDKSALSQRLTLDFDGVRSDVFKLVGCDEAGLRTMAEAMLANLPAEFADVSYIAQASASYGRSTDRVSLHIEFLLDGDVAPVEIKRYLEGLNFDSPALRDQIELSSNALALRWPLDVSVADNSKIIFVGTPVFEGVENPFENDENRIILVQKQRATLNSEVIRKVNGAELRSQKAELIKELRRAGGMRAKTPRIKEVVFGGESLEIMTNPEEVTIKIDSDEGDYVRANINGGDSGAYWWPKANPEYVLNFKGEPAFKMKQAAPAFYQQYKETYKSFILESAGLESGDLPIVFREPVEDVYYSMIYNETEDKIKHFAPISLASIENFMANWGQDRPEILPEYRLEFNPTTNRQFDEAARWVNKFRPTEYLLATDMPDEWSKPTEYGELAVWVEKLAPSFFYNIKHVLGNVDAEMEHFLNWLAYVCQYREKSATAWILLGRTGTGKGLLFDMFFRKVFGEYAKTAKTDTIDDDKNGFLEDALIVFVDEFKENDGRSSSRLHNVIKNMVTEKNMTIRHMRQTAKTVRNYTNFLFSANDLNIMTITDDDRRFNIGTRQDKSIKDTYPSLPREIDDDAQLMKFCRMLNTHNVDKEQVQVLVENAWRTSVQIASMSVADQFFHAIQHGDADFFYEEIVLEGHFFMEPIVYVAAKAIVLKLVENAAQEGPLHTQVAPLLSIYNHLANKPMKSSGFKQALLRKGLNPKRHQFPGGSKLAVIDIDWKMQIHDATAIIEEAYLMARNTSSLEERRAARNEKRSASAAH